MAKRDFLTLADFSQAQWTRLFERAREYKRDRLHPTHASLLAGRSVALVFEKASTRTRVSFEVGVAELGGRAVVLSSAGSQLARGEPIEDTARVLSGYCHAIMIRTFGQDRAARLAAYATVPVINGLTDLHHPCQIAADLLTVQEQFSDWQQRRFAWIGDGNNMAHSWIEAAGLFGLDLILACPEGFAPDADIMAAARARQATAGGSLTLVTDPELAARDAHVISTDVWASMGQEDDAARRRLAFRGYCVDAHLMRLAAPDAMVLHCLPAHRGEEISAEVLEGPQAAVWRQAENRLHVQKAIIAELFC